MKRKHTWGSIYLPAVRRGYDHGYAAYLAERWAARKHKLIVLEALMSDENQQKRNT